MNAEEQQIALVQTLLRSFAWKAQDPESFKLFCGGFLCDMANRTKARPVLDSGWEIRFRYVLCQDDLVLAAALPYAVREDGKETPLHQWEENALRAAGIPLFADFLEETTEQNGEKTLSIKPSVCLEPSGWRFPTVAVPPEVKEFLVKKGLVLQEPYGGHIPSAEGGRLGLCAVHWRRACRFARMKSLSCSTAGWLYRLWAPKETPPLWKLLPLDTRLERIRSGRASSLGHITFAFKQLDAMPLEPLLLKGINETALEENLSELQEMYPPGITYGQAARDADAWMRSERSDVQKMGYNSFIFLVALFCRSSDQIIQKSEGGNFRKPKNSDRTITAIHKTQLAGRSLSERLAWAGVTGRSCRYLPLEGDDLEDVFQGLSILLGSDEPARSFYQKSLPQILPGWNRSEEQKKRWDGTFGELIHTIVIIASGHGPEFHYGKRASDKAPPCLGFLDQMTWQLVIEPFCLLDQVWKLEEERGRLLEGLQAWNESLKQELEGMNFNGSTP